MKMILTLVVVGMLGAIIVGCNKEAAPDSTVKASTNSVTSTNK